MRSQGFSLLEILVAFSLLALGLGILLRIFADGAHSLTRAQQYQRAAQIAEAVLAEMGTDRSGFAGEQHGTTADGYAWTTTIADDRTGAEKTASLAVRPRVVTAEIAWQDGARTRRVSFTTVRLVGR